MAGRPRKYPPGDAAARQRASRAARRDAGLVAVTSHLPAATVDALDAMAAEHGTSRAEIVARIVIEACRDEKAPPTA